MADVDLEDIIDEGVMTELEDGSVEFVLDEDDTLEDAEDYDHYENIALSLDEEEKKKIALQVINGYTDDKVSRMEWEDNMARGFGLLGMMLDETSDPFPGACAAVHPLITESAVKFQAKASKELFPSTGPVKTKVLGAITPEKEDMAERVKHHLNYQLTEQMDDYFHDLEKMLFYLPVIGSAIKKVSYDAREELPSSEFIPCEHFVISNKATSLKKAERYTHVLYKTEYDIEVDMVNGIYDDSLDLGEPGLPEISDLQQIQEEMFGLTSGVSKDDMVYTILEQHMYLDLPGKYEDDRGISLPYIVSVDLGTEQVLSIRRNWKQSDPLKRKRVWFVHYPFVPGIGFLGHGLIHLLGNFHVTLTTTMRSLVDSGQFANLQGGFKARGVKVLGDQAPIGFGEWRDVEATGQDLSKALYPLPYKEPSIVLFKMLEFLEGRGQKFADSTEQVIADSTNYGPVGTTLALLEESTRFFSGIHKRLHQAQGKEFKLIAEINAEFLDEEYPYDVPGEERTVFSKDYSSEQVQVIPVSDPNISSKAQRISLAQTELQSALQRPDIHNMRNAYMEFYKALGLEKEQIERILPSPEEAQQNDPITDIQYAVQGKPVKAFPGQDHDSHIKVKQMWINDPMNGKDPLMQNAVAPLVANIREHMMLRYTETIQGALQNEGQDMSNEAAIALAAEKVAAFNNDAAESRGMGDPLYIAAKAQMLEAETKSKEALHNQQIDMAKLALEAMKLQLAEQKEANRQTESIQKQGQDLYLSAMDNIDKSVDREMQLEAMKEKNKGNGQSKV